MSPVSSGALVYISVPSVGSGRCWPFPAKLAKRRSAHVHFCSVNFCKDSLKLFIIFYIFIIWNNTNDVDAVYTSHDCTRGRGEDAKLGELRLRHSATMLLSITMLDAPRASLPQTPTCFDLTHVVLHPTPTTASSPCPPTAPDSNTIPRLVFTSITHGPLTRCYHTPQR